MRLIGILLCFFCQSAAAANLNKGDVEVHGGFSLTRSDSWYYWSGHKRRTTFSVAAGIQYFLVNHFSAGLDLSVMKTGGYRSLTWSVGPAATYYFLTKEKIAPFVFLSPLRISKTEGLSPQYRSTARLGVKYFLTDSVAFGPALQYERQWPKGWGGGSKNDISLIGQFSVHL